MRSCCHIHIRICICNCIRWQQFIIKLHKKKHIKSIRKAKAVHAKNSYQTNILQGAYRHVSGCKTTDPHKRIHFFALLYSPQIDEKKTCVSPSIFCTLSPFRVWVHECNRKPCDRIMATVYAILHVWSTRKLWKCNTTSDVTKRYTNDFLLCQTKLLAMLRGFCLRRTNFAQRVFSLCSPKT